MTALIVSFLASHGLLSVLVSIVAVLKVTFTPIMSALEQGIVASKDQNAINKMHDVEASGAYKAIVEIINTLTSFDLSTVLAAVSKK